MSINPFYTIDEAATYLAITKRDIFHLADSDQLPVCFRLTGTLLGVTVTSPDGSIEFIKPDVLIEGTVSSLVFRGNDSKLEATLVSIIQLNGRPIITGHKLPVTDFPYRIIPSFAVHGFLQYVEVLQSDWLFNIDDLKELAVNSNLTGASERVSKLRMERDHTKTIKLAELDAIEEFKQRKCKPAPATVEAPPADSNSGISATGKAEAVPFTPLTFTPAPKAATDTTPAPASKGITKNAVISAFEGLHYDGGQWKRLLSDQNAKWLLPCRVARGDKNTSSLWNPPDIALTLLDKGILIRKLDAVFVGLQEWQEEWQKKAAIFRD